MNIAIDFDCTYTNDPELWDAFIVQARARGHCLWCVTCRHETEENAIACDVPGVLTIFTDGAPKQWFMREKRIEIAVWIDDDPRSILYGK